MIDLTITIPTYNEERDLACALESIAKQDYPMKKFEVIVVDNYSTDSTLKIAESFASKINIRILKNPIKDAEVSKMKGFKASKGKYFMYMDADMCLSDPSFISKSLFPLKEKNIAGTFVRFLVNKNHPPLTRSLSYDEWQRDPILKFFTIGVKDIIVSKKEGYLLCKCDKNKVPPQSLMIYKKDLIKDYVKNEKQLIDNEIPAVLVGLGHTYFAFVPDTGIYHLLLRKLSELSHKRIRNLERTYYPNKKVRKFKWINFKKDWPKIGLWILYTNSFLLPIANSIFKTIKYRDICFLNEPILNMVSTYSIIYGVLKNEVF